MLDWIGSLRVRETTERRVVLSISRSTQIVGMLLLVLGIYTGWLTWPISRWLAALPLAMGLLGLLLVTLRRQLVFDREAGVLRVDQSAFGLNSRAVVPLFHLRAVVIAARGDDHPDGLRKLVAPRRFVAYVERRIGGAIYLDEAKRCANLMPLAEAIADVAELRLEYDNTSHASQG